MTIQISSQFDAGNIEVIDSDDPGNIRLKIRPDVGDQFYQWFYFRVSGARDQAISLKIENASGASYPSAWNGYQAVVSTDRVNWTRAETHYSGGQLEIRLTPDRDLVWVAYFTPYSMERHADLLSHVQAQDFVKIHCLGQTLDGQSLDMIEAGTGPLQVWIIGRQHPGETMAEFWMEGFIDRLLDPNNSCSREFLERATFHIVPNMNPDGSRRGHLRTNAAGANLNREWLEPSMERSPEVFLVREKMAQTRVDFCLDVHGDEELPYNFIAGSDGIPSLNDDQIDLLGRFRHHLIMICPDFQLEHGYPVDARGEANLSMCTNYVAETHECLAMTLEQPFKDAANAPWPGTGWSGPRSAQLGAACLTAMYAMINHLEVDAGLRERPDEMGAMAQMLLGITK